jgi:hypothetical protein
MPREVGGARLPDTRRGFAAFLSAGVSLGATPHRCRAVRATAEQTGGLSALRRCLRGGAHVPSRNTPYYLEIKLRLFGSLAPPTRSICDVFANPHDFRQNTCSFLCKCAVYRTLGVGHLFPGSPGLLALPWNQYSFRQDRQTERGG